MNRFKPNLINLNIDQQCCYWLLTLPIEHGPFFNAAEQELLLEGCAEFENLIKKPECAKARREGWEKVEDKLSL